MTLIIFAIALAFYFFLHSLLATERVKSFLTKKLIPERFYRLIYNIASVILLLPLAWLFFSLENQPLLKNQWLALPGGLFLAAGLVWIFRAMRDYDLGEFTGFFQLKNGRQPAHTSLNVSGLNSQVRHPLYFGTLLLVWGAFLVWPVVGLLVVAAVSTIYLYVGSWLEERKLEQQFGDAYRSYQRNVPMLLPFNFKQKKKNAS